jgi:uncharacterized lipoprotein YehR (DUF1307 family)
MTRFQQISALLLAFVTMIGLSACGESEKTSTQGGQVEAEQKGFDTGKYLWTGDKKLPDGRTVSCVVYAAGYAGGLSCDWANAK